MSMKKAVKILIILIIVLIAIVAAIIIIDNVIKNDSSAAESTGQTAEADISEGQTMDITASSQDGGGAENIHDAKANDGSGTDEGAGNEQDTVDVSSAVYGEKPADSLSSVYSTRFSTEQMSLIKEMISEKADGRDFEGTLQELKSENAKDGEAIESIMDYWDTVKEDGFANSVANGGTGISAMDDCPVNSGVEGALLPEGLSDDDSLCIVGLGFELNRDGTMKDELLGRLETIRACAMQYPNAYVLVTGGPTALLDRSIAEADVMHDWLVENGVDNERIIVENNSMTSATNALYSYEILLNEYPQVSDIAIVTSDYHVALGSLLFEAQFEMARAAGDVTPLHVVTNAAYTSDGIYGFDWVSEGNWLWILVQEQVASEHDIPDE